MARHPERRCLGAGRKLLPPRRPRNRCGSSTRQPTVPLPLRDFGPMRSAELQLFVSTDEGRTWRLHDRQPLHQQTEWAARLVHDGRYWLAVQAMDAAGKQAPADSLQAEYQVIVDSQMPGIVLQLAQASENQVVGSFRVTDANLAPPTLSYDGFLETAPGQVVACRRADAVVFPSSEGFDGRVIWQFEGEGRFIARISIADIANNQSTAEKQLPVASSQPRDRAAPTGGRHCFTHPTGCGGRTAGACACPSSNAQAIAKTHRSGIAPSGSGKRRFAARITATRPIDAFGNQPEDSRHCAAAIHAEFICGSAARTAAANRPKRGRIG